MRADVQVVEVMQSGASDGAAGDEAEPADTDGRSDEVMKFYIAGPMTHYKFFNFPAFDRAKAIITQSGDEAISPADIDRANGFDGMMVSPDDPCDQWPTTMGWDTMACIQRDIDAIKTCDAIYLLDGWEKSVGANAELAVAKWMGKHIAYQNKPKASGEVRVTDPTTGGQKGSKGARFSLFASGPLWELAEHFGVGAKKYADRNWEKGYDWHLSFDAVQRHLWQFWNGEDRDPETGSKHVIAAMWHCMALAWFMDHRREKDDRPKHNRINSENNEGK